MRRDDDEGGGHATYFIEGEELPRVPFGMEREREDSPCPGCGAYFGDFHQAGCDVEECPRCGGQVATCGCIDAPKAG